MVQQRLLQRRQRRLLLLVEPRQPLGFGGQGVHLFDNLTLALQIGVAEWHSIDVLLIHTGLIDGLLADTQPVASRENVLQVKVEVGWQDE